MEPGEGEETMKTVMMRVVLGLVCLATSGGWVTAAAESEPKLATLLERHFAAVGGRAKWAAVAGLHFRGVGQEGASTLKFDFHYRAPGKLVFIGSIGGEVLIRMGRDQQSRCWRQDPSGVRDLDEKQSTELLDLGLAFFGTAQLPFSDSWGDQVCARGQKEELEVWICEPASGEERYPRLMFEAASGRLLEVGAINIEDYCSVGELTVPFRVQAGERTTFQVEEVLVNPVVDEAIFERPAAATSGAGLVPTAGEMPALEDRFSAPGTIEIVRQPPPADFRRGRMLKLPVYDPTSRKSWQVDLRGYDLTGLDLSDGVASLWHADFDSVTRWPAVLPGDFDPSRQLELGKDSGLGVRRLHERGIDGRGIGIGIIDQPLLVDHVEYRDRLRLYEEIHSPAGAPAQMHGPAVASIAVGRTVGVAPGADLYYIAEQHGVFRPGHGFDWDFGPLARSIDRLLEVNRTLPRERRIRVISISVGWSPSQKGYEEAMAATERAGAEGVFVISTAIEATHGLAFHGLGRSASSDPNQFEAYEPGSWWAEAFWDGQRRFAPGERLLVPMDRRGVASPTGADHYVHYATGGWSWSVPWIAGLYALACQAQPDLTPDLFWSKALETGRVIRVRKGEVDCELGTVADPVALLEALAHRG
jgi:hypothetical protein